jgi:dihydroflavonol-4-reductase
LSDEETLWDLWDTGLYSRSKFLGEVEALRAGARGLDVVICCPHQLLGDGDFGPSTPGRIVVLFAQGKIPLYVNAKSQFLDADDCAEGHLLAAQKGRRGEKYILAGSEAVDMKTFFQALSEITGREAPKYTAPFWLVKTFAYLLEWTADHLTHRPPLLTVGNARMIPQDMTCSIDKARKDLGFSPGSWRGALEKAAGWFRENGYFEKPLS